MHKLDNSIYVFIFLLCKEKDPGWSVDTFYILMHDLFEHNNADLYTFVVVVVLRDWVSLCSHGFPGTHSVDPSGLELKNLPASASQVLGSKACPTTTRVCILFNDY